MLCISWSKGGRLGTDLDMKSVIRIGYDFGLLWGICLRVDGLWVGIKFTRPKLGKTYHKSHGTLPEAH